MSKTFLLIFVSEKTKTFMNTEMFLKSYLQMKTVFLLMKFDLKIE